MAWVDIPATDTDIDSPEDEDLFESLAGNDVALRVAPVGWGVAEVTASSTGYVTLATVYVRIPDVASSAIQRKLVFRFECKVASGGTGTFKVTDNAAAVDSTEATTTSTSYEDKEVTLNFAEGLAGTTRQIDIKGKYTTTSPANLQIVDSFTSELQF